jgi:hypothetical protein
MLGTPSRARTVSVGNASPGSLSLGRGRPLKLPAPDANAAVVTPLLALAVALTLDVASLAGLFSDRVAPPAAPHAQRAARQSLLSLPLRHARRANRHWAVRARRALAEGHPDERPRSRGQLSRLSAARVGSRLVSLSRASSQALEPAPASVLAPDVIRSLDTHARRVQPQPLKSRRPRSTQRVAGAGRQR